MRLSVVVVFAVILGGSFGIARTWSEFAGVEERMELPALVQVGDEGTVAETPTTNPPTADTVGTPRAEVIGASSVDFGILKRDNSKNHSFLIRNAGDADLLVEKQTVSCTMCVNTTFESATLKPGEEVTIPVTLTARKRGPELNEALELRTNDKAHEVIRFDLIAYVSEAAGTSVDELALGTISTDKGASGSFRVYGFVDEPLEIVECRLGDRENQNYVEWEINDLTPDFVKSVQSHAKSGKEINVKVKPGLPVGPLELQFAIVARVGEEVKLNVGISGRVTGDLSLIGGSKFNSRTSTLFIGRVLPGEGASTKLQLMVKGEHRDDVQLSVGSCEPPEHLSASIGERRTIRNGYLYPVTVEVNEGAPAVIRLGGVGTEPGKIVIQTTHPTAKEVTLYVRFAVE